MDPKMVRRAWLSGAAGFFMETYEFGIYGIVAAYLAAEFFSSGNPTVSLLLTWIVFAIPFAIRPLGGIVLGSIGDRFGRKRVMLLSIVIMCGSTVLIGLIPGEAIIGIAAPIAVIACRLIQGAVFGGETANAVTFAGEWAPRRIRASRIAFVQTGATLGNMVGSSLAFVLTFTLGASLMQAWGWRMLFLFALPLAALGFYIRYRVGETPAFQTLADTGALAAAPIRDAVKSRNTRASMAKCILIAAILATGYYGVYIVLPAYLVNTIGFAPAEGMLVTLIGLAALAVLSIGWGRLADRVNRRWLGCGAAVAMAVLALPAFSMIRDSGGSLAVAIGATLMLTVPYSVINAVTHSVIFDLLSTRTRSTSYAIAFGIAVALFGGLAPFIGTALIGLTGDAASPAYFLILAAVVSIIGYLLINERRVTARGIDPGAEH
ncbi:MFS transporter [Microbacterium sp. E-13]|uniref:MFS transporter n=1 Tax=Microbacterium sp. E-13 TaxID=3404048 RepID=UPI003CEC0A83